MLPAAASARLDGRGGRKQCWIDLLPLPSLRPAGLAEAHRVQRRRRVVAHRCVTPARLRFFSFPQTDAVLLFSEPCRSQVSGPGAAPEHANVARPRRLRRVAERPAARGAAGQTWRGQVCASFPENSRSDTAAAPRGHRPSGPPRPRRSAPIPLCVAMRTASRASCLSRRLGHRATSASLERKTDPSQRSLSLSGQMSPVPRFLSRSAQTASKDAQIHSLRSELAAVKRYAAGVERSALAAAKARVRPRVASLRPRGRGHPATTSS